MSKASNQLVDSIMNSSREHRANSEIQWIDSDSGNTHEASPLVMYIGIFGLLCVIGAVILLFAK